MKKTLLPIIAVFIVGFALFPFSLLFGPAHLRNYLYKELLYKKIAHSLTRQGGSDFEKSERMLEWVYSHQLKDLALGLVYKDPLNDLVRSIGFCDQSAKGLGELARKIGIKARVIGLYGYDEVSHHSVAELEIDGSFRIFDTYHGITFKNADGTFSDFNDLQKNRVTGLVPQTDRIWRPDDAFMQDYLKFYEPTYPSEVTWDNYSSDKDYSKDYKRLFMAGLVDLYYQILGDAFFIPFEKLYFKMQGTGKFKIARYKHLTSRYQEAIENYTELVNGASNSMTEEELKYWDGINQKAPEEDSFRFFRGQAYLHALDYQSCAAEFNELLALFPKSKWTESAGNYLQFCKSKGQSGTVQFSSSLLTQQMHSTQ